MDGMRPAVVAEQAYRTPSLRDIYDRVLRPVSTLAGKAQRERQRAVRDDFIRNNVEDAYRIFSIMGDELGLARVMELCACEQPWLAYHIGVELGLTHRR